VLDVHRCAVIEHQVDRNVLVALDEAFDHHAMRHLQIVGIQVELPVLPVVVDRALVLVKAREERKDVVGDGIASNESPLALSQSGP
jgi:hypothetical protein